MRLAETGIPSLAKAIEHLAKSVARPEPKKTAGDVVVTLSLTKEEWAELWNSIDTKIVTVKQYDEKDIDGGEEQRTWWLRTLKSARDRSFEQLAQQGVSV